MVLESKARKHPIWFAVILIILPLVVGLMALGFGRYTIGLDDVIRVLKGNVTGEAMLVSPAIQNVVLNLRVPRILTALAVGGGLSVAGAAMQGLFSNPLATPDTIGVGSGAAFGAVVGILLTNNIYIIQLLAFIMGIVATLFTYKLSRLSGNRGIVMIVLSGMIVSSFFSALISLLKTLADTDTQLPSIVYWLMGSMAAANYNVLLVGLPFILIGIAVIYMMRWKINLLQLTEDEARSMGIKVGHMRVIIMGSATLITAAVVSMCGQVGWIGLLVPHLSRMIIGSNNKYMIPVSISFGACFMVIIDTLARTVSPMEIPLSILTAIIGTPFFAYLIYRTGGAWR